MTKLKAHILPRIKDILVKEAASNLDTHLPQPGPSVEGGHVTSSSDHNSVLFKDDRMYRHHLARFNYTTYDVRRAQDVVNPGTSHRDIMLLANSGAIDSDLDHPFLYARILSIYHVNIIYMGDGM